MRAAGLDATFGGDGVVTTPVGANSEARAVVLQPDGKIVAAGLAAPPQSTYHAVLARYATDGSLDPTFGTGGIVTTAVQYASGLNAVALQPDGKIVVAGSSSDGTTASVLVARYEDDGTLDATFGAGGLVVTPFGVQSTGEGIALQSDGKIVVTGTLGELDASDVLVLRFASDGTLDETFDGDGIVVTDMAPPGRDLGAAVALQADGGIVVAGTRASAGSGDWKLAALRYTTTGALDPTFGSGGIVVTPLNGFARALVLRPDQKIVIGGGNSDGHVARLLTDGTLDTTFGDDGMLSIGGGSNPRVVLKTLAHQDPDRLILAGTVTTILSFFPFPDSKSDVFLTRLLDDGETSDLDTIVDLGTKLDDVEALVPLADGSIVGAGSASSDLTVFRFETSVCGDGAIEGPEVCDDANPTDGDGCDHNCRPTGCGNGIVTVGEVCDDGNTASGDCCSAVCEPETAGTPCTSDGNACTDDACFANGTCGHVTNSSSCDDGNGCTSGDTCNGGTCQGSPVDCGPCNTCSSTTHTCVGAPRSMCRPLPLGGTAPLQIADKPTSNGKKMQWSRKATDTSAADLGAPNASTEYALCLYDASIATNPLLSKVTFRQGLCGESSCWKDLGGRGWKYRDKTRIPDGAEALVLKAATGLTSKLNFKGRGANLPVPTLPLPLPARLQLQATNGSCWEAWYSAAGARRNTTTQFNGISD